mgnify:CR=1 FL=1
MRAVVTRVTEASVVIEGKTVGSIQKGFLVLLGVAPEDTEAEAIRLAEEQGKGAIALHGKMIDAPIVTRAEQTIAMARELGLGRED